jgi:sialidase-1
MNSIGRYLLSLALVFAGLQLTSAAETPVPELVDVFVGGQDGYPAYRIPSLVSTKHGSLLAFAEGRATAHDHSENDIVMRRSTDHGKTWGKLQLIAEDGTNALNNPTAVVLRGTDRILLMYQRYARGFDERKAAPGLDGPHICRTFISQSDDDGSSWSRPIDVTAQVKRATEVTSTATGPGIGIQLSRGKRAGRILMPFNQGPYGKWKVYAAFSDDGGNSWRYGQTAPEDEKGFANEVQFVELNDGSVMLNARNQGGNKHRKISISHDGGETWEATRTDPVLIEPVCQASLLRHPGVGNQDLFLFSNPASESSRTNGTIRLSRDQGKTWPVARRLYPGSFSYSCLASLTDNSVGCLFERDGNKRISFARFTISWVEQAGDSTLDKADRR